MNIIQVIVLSITQGITEWFPVSSSGHLALIQEFFNMNVPIAFDVFLHFASLIVIILVFWKDIRDIILGIVKKDKKYINIFLYLIIASVPAAVVGFLLKDKIESIFSNILFIGISLVTTGILLFLTKFAKNKNKELNIKNSITIGLAQAFAILPGISRSGSTISIGLLSGLNSREAARFSFLLSIPAILGASILEIKDMGRIDNIWYLLIGFFVTIIIGFLSLKYLLKIIDKNKFKNFSFYCVLLGVLVIIYSLYK